MPSRASAEGSLLGHPQTPTRRAPRTKCTDLGPGAAALEGLLDQLTLELRDGDEHGHPQAGGSERIELRAPTQPCCLHQRQMASG
jgi:hypothetical protein